MSGRADGDAARRSPRWWLIGGLIVVAVVGIAFLASLAVNDSAGGAVAIEQAQQSAEAGLRDKERRIAEMGGAPRVS